MFKQELFSWEMVQNYQRSLWPTGWPTGGPDMTSMTGNSEKKKTHDPAQQKSTRTLVQDQV